MKYLTRDEAADYLREKGVRVKGQGLKDHAKRQTGPKYRIINQRALYTKEDLDEWIMRESQTAPPHHLRKNMQQPDGHSTPNDHSSVQSNLLTKPEAALEALSRIVEIIDGIPPEDRERTVRAAMILVGSPLRDTPTQL